MAGGRTARPSETVCWNRIAVSGRKRAAISPATSAPTIAKAQARLRIQRGWTDRTGAGGGWTAGAAWTGGAVARFTGATALGAGAGARAATGAGLGAAGCGRFEAGTPGGFA